MKIIEASNKFTLILKIFFVLLLAISFLGWPILIWLGFARLKHIPKDDVNYRPLKYLLAISVFIYIVALIYVGYVWVSRVEFGENQDSARFMPLPEAKNISYYLKFDFSAYEFTMDEENIIKYRSSLKEVVEPVTVKRYKYRLENIPEEERTVTVENGLFVTDGESTIVFDREKSRVYVVHERQK